MPLARAFGQPRSFRIQITDAAPPQFARILTVACPKCAATVRDFAQTLGLKPGSKSAFEPVDRVFLLKETPLTH